MIENFSQAMGTAWQLQLSWPSSLTFVLRTSPILPWDLFNFPRLTVNPFWELWMIDFYVFYSLLDCLNILSWSRLWGRVQAAVQVFGINSCLPLGSDDNCANPSVNSVKTSLWVSNPSCPEWIVNVHMNDMSLQHLTPKQKAKSQTRPMRMILSAIFWCARKIGIPTFPSLKWKETQIIRKASAFTRMSGTCSQHI